MVVSVAEAVGGLEVGFVELAEHAEGHVGGGVVECGVGGGHGGTDVSRGGCVDHVGELGCEVCGEGINGLGSDVGIGRKIHSHAAGDGRVVGHDL
jgi:hypothetical protein